MAEYQVQARIIARSVEATSEGEAVERLAQIFSTTLIVASGSARKLSKADLARRKQQG